MSPNNEVGHLMNLENAMKFFSMCQKLGLTSREDRLSLLGAMNKEGFTTRLDSKDFKRIMNKKKALVIKGDESNG